MDAADKGWGEEDSRTFIDRGAYYVPEREAQIDTVASVIPPPPQGAIIVDVCCGEGLLAEAIARRFPAACVHALDGSPAMLEAAGARLKAAGVRHRLAAMEIAERGWRRFPVPVHAFVSSLAIHHLDGPGKALLFADLARQLAPGGVLVVCDLVEAQREAGRALWQRQWDEGVAGRARALDGHEGMLDRFRQDGWNYYADPAADPVDMPSGLFEQLRWLADAGLEAIDVHWLKAGHAIFSGMRP